MSDDLVTELRTTKLFEAGEWESGLGLEAAARIERDGATIARLTAERDALEWFAEISAEQAVATRAAIAAAKGCA